MTEVILSRVSRRISDDDNLLLLFILLTQRIPIMHGLCALEGISEVSRNLSRVLTQSEWNERKNSQGVVDRYKREGIFT